MREIGSRRERAAESFAHTVLCIHAIDERGVHLDPRLVRHTERTVAKTGGDVFGCGTETRDLVIVNCRRAVHGNLCDRASLHEMDEQRTDAGLDDMSAEHRDDSAAGAGRSGDGVDDGAKVARNQDVGQRAQKGAERRVRLRRARELIGRDFVGPPRDWNGAYGGEICLRPGRSQGCVVDGWTVLA
jgi:hypothetical protein